MSTSDDTAAIEARLLALRETLHAEAQQGEAAAGTVELDQSKVGRLSRMDALQGQAMAQAAQVRRQQSLKLVELALQRLAAGEYGDCVDCEEPIDPRRLAVDPLARRCIQCAEAAQSS
ncbi:MAG: TraR/DksA C4-type zinc finger protein [Pseudomonadota bacterium]